MMEDNITNYTFDDSLEIQGLFGNTPNIQQLDDDKISGTLLIKNGVGELNILGKIEKVDYTLPTSGVIINNENLLRYSNEGYIYGFLENGNIIRLDKFYMKDYKTSFPGLERASYDVEKIRSIIGKTDNFDFPSNYAYISINSLVYWGFTNQFFPPHNLSTVGPNVPVGSFDYKNLYFSLEICPSRFHKTNARNQNVITTYNSLTFKIIFPTTCSDEQLEAISEEINKFIIILTHHASYISKIQKDLKSEKLNISSSVISHHGDKSDIADYSSIREPLSYQNIQSGFDFQKYLTNYLSKSFELNVMINSFLMNINGNLVVENSLLSYSNAIDIYYRNATYTTNNKLIKNFKDKLSRFIDEIPPKIRSLFFSSTDKKDFFVKATKTTRDFLVHGIHSESNFVLNDVRLTLLVINLDWLVYITILTKLGIDEATILNVLKNYHIPVSENDILS
ncbi:HEPN domain-containing protein [Leuconostoc fallax]|uniref:Apea-like HEPN domain-containing protein n=2 Tax=Leuconostoc fallax TaxID=1251 RepID=A0A4R5N9T7_9LACO|nr:HEPN domain-containing protein [Leuconostoc fallax]MBU7455458.1 hypothetical protein [Leuconostoc fallax]TDG68294.1 hypothetical protein C5L23_000600 [Leuconostoc fallax]